MESPFTDLRGEIGALEKQVQLYEKALRTMASEMDFFYAGSFDDETRRRAANLQAKVLTTLEVKYSNYYGAVECHLGGKKINEHDLHQLWG